VPIPLPVAAEPAAVAPEPLPDALLLSHAPAPRIFNSVAYFQENYISEKFPEKF